MTVIPRTPPTVSGLPIVGNMLDLMATPGMRAFLTRAYQQHGPVYQVRALNTVMTVLAGPEANTFVMKEGHKVLRSEEAWRPNDLELGAQRSMISLDGEQHRLYRRAESRAYSRSHFAANVRPALKVAAEDLTAFQAGDDFPVTAFCKSVITEQLARIVVGGMARPYLDDLLKFIQTALMVTVTKQLPRLVLHSPAYQQCKARVLQMVEGLIAEHRAHTPEEIGRSPDLLDDVLADAKIHPELWGERDLRLAGLSAFIAGMDTAANSLAFVLYRLHKHPEYLPDIRAEVDAAFHHGRPSAEQLAQCKHLLHFVMETMRVHPIAPAMNRTLTQDIEFGGYHLKAGTNLIIGTTVSHGLERSYRDPETFDPTRFAAPRSEHRQPGAYVPFGVGAHTCAGSGMAEGLIMLNAAAILHTLDCTLPATYTLKETARPTPSPDTKLVLKVGQVRHAAVSLLA